MRSCWKNKINNNLVPTARKCFSFLTGSSHDSVLGRKEKVISKSWYSMNLRENEKSRTIDKNVFNSFFDFKFDY